MSDTEPQAQPLEAPERISPTLCLKCGSIRLHEPSCRNCGAHLFFDDEVEYVRADLPRAAADDDEAAIFDDERVDKELRRWQDAIRDKMIEMGVPDSRIDGAGCDSGDPLDFTLAEVGQGVGYFIDKLEEVTTPRATETLTVEAALAELQQVVPDSRIEITAWFKPEGYRGSLYEVGETLEDVINKVRAWAKSRAEREGERT